MNTADREALIAYRRQCAQEALEEARGQIAMGFWRVAVARFYYAAFYSVTALLLTKGEHPKTHKGVRQRFGALFISTGEVEKRHGDVLTLLFEKRHSGDYDDFVSMDEETVMRLQPMAEATVAHIEEILSNRHDLGSHPDEHMLVAIAEARLGRSEGGIPIGSVLVQDGKIIARGHNKRVQEKNPILHGEMDCLNNAGRIGSYKGTTIYSTLMPCYMCAGTIVQFKIRKVIVGESRTFAGARAFMESHGVKVVDLDLPECVAMMEEFIAAEPALWNEDIGE